MVCFAAIGRNENGICSRCKVQSGGKSSTGIEGKMEKEKYKISVIVPVYNKREYLEQCIDSILGQSYSNWELVLVDDESTDGSRDICDAYSRKDGRIRVFHQKNGGSTAAVLKGMEKAEGEYYVFIDSDDYVSGEMLEKMAEHAVGRKGGNYLLQLCAGKAERNSSRHTAVETGGI